MREKETCGCHSKSRPMYSAPRLQALWSLSPRVFALERGIHKAPHEQKYSQSWSCGAAAAAAASASAGKLGELRVCILGHCPFHRKGQNQNQVSESALILSLPLCPSSLLPSFFLLLFLTASMVSDSKCKSNNQKH